MKCCPWSHTPQKESLKLYQENTDVRTEADKYKAELDAIKEKLPSVKPPPAPGSAVRKDLCLPKWLPHPPGGIGTSP